MNKTIFNPGFWNNKRVLITGHTGFKGSWLNLNLQLLNCKTYGISLIPNEMNVLHNEISIETKNFYENICNYENIKQIVQNIKPHIVFHLAAQPLVSESYKYPLKTFETNLMGTINLIEACKKIETVQSMVIVTTDKVYQNNEDGSLFKENDTLGGKDPYSSSKTCAEIACECYINTLIDDKFKIATARAGNVIGGGDWSANRIIPDYIRAWQENHSMIVRSPESVRPWQHVIEPNFGYILLAENLATKKNKIRAVNFGPDRNSIISVKNLIEILKKLNENGPKIILDENSNLFEESKVLMLDNSFAKKLLKWYPQFSIYESIEKTVDWYRSYYNNENIKNTSLKQLRIYYDQLGVNI